MKTSHIVAIAAVVIIGLIFFFSGSSDPSSDSQVAPADTQSVEDTDNANTESQPQDTESENTLLESETELDASLDATSQTESDSEPTEHVFTLDSFKFGYSQEEIRVEQGDTVTINLTNSDGYHDWVVDEFDAATEKINVGETTSVTFVADKEGTFEYYCSVGNHREQGMVGTLIVE